MTITVGELVSFGPQARGRTKKGVRDEAVHADEQNPVPNGERSGILQKFLFHSHLKALGILQSSEAKTPCWPETPAPQLYVSILL